MRIALLALFGVTAFGIAGCVETEKPADSPIGQSVPLDWETAPPGFGNGMGTSNR